MLKYHRNECKLEGQLDSPLLSSSALLSMLHLSTSLHHWKTFISSPFVLWLLQCVTEAAFLKISCDLKSPFPLLPTQLDSKGLYLARFWWLSITHECHLMCLGSLQPMVLKVLGCHLYATHTTQQWRTLTRWYTCCSVYSFSSNLGTTVLCFLCVAIFKNGGFRKVVPLMTHGAFLLISHFQFDLVAGTTI